MKLKKLFILLYVYIGLITCIVTCLFIYSINDSEFFPINEDESIYYNSARLFYETNSTKAVICISENRSAIGQYNWYGPAYQLIYGLIAKIFGFTKTYFITFHYLLFIASIFLLWLLPLNKIKRLFFISIYLSTYASFSFIFTYFPEMLNMVITIILLVIFSRINLKTNKLIYAFIPLILLFSIIRITNVFWIFSIIVFADTIKRKIQFSAISFLVFFIVFLYMKLFTAPSYVLGLNSIHNGEFMVSNVFLTIKILLLNAIHNSIALFSNANSSVILILLLMVTITYSIFNSTNKHIWVRHKIHVLGILTVIVTTMIVELLLYYTQALTIEKQIAFFIPLLIFIIILLGKNYKLIFFFCCFIFLPISILKSKNYVDAHKEFSHLINSKKEYINNLSEFSNPIHADKKEINILWLYSEYEIPNNMTLTVLPVSLNRKPLLYTTNICNENANDSVKFKMYHKIDIDYILSKDSISLKNIDLVQYNPKYYYLYKCK